MHPMAARVLLIMQLLPEQIETLRNHERRLEPGHYLQGAEIAAMFKMRPTAAAPENTEMLDRMWHEYQKRIAWKLHGMHDTFHDLVCAKTEAKGPWCECPTTQDEIHDWEDWAIENFGRTWDEIRWQPTQKALQRTETPTH